jgi:hypothetical protein
VSEKRDVLRRLDPSDPEDARLYKLGQEIARIAAAETEHKMRMEMLACFCHDIHDCDDDCASHHSDCRRRGQTWPKATR